MFNFLEGFRSQPKLDYVLTAVAANENRMTRYCRRPSPLPGSPTVRGLLGVTTEDSPSPSETWELIPFHRRVQDVPDERVGGLHKRNDGPSKVDAALGSDLSLLDMAETTPKAT